MLYVDEGPLGRAMPKPVERFGSVWCSPVGELHILSLCGWSELLSIRGCSGDVAYWMDYACGCMAGRNNPRLNGDTELVVTENSGMKEKVRTLVLEGDVVETVNKMDEWCE